MTMKRLAALVLALMLACGAALAETAPTQEPAATTAPTAVPVDPNAIVLKVGDKTFTQAQLDEYELTVAYAYYGTTDNADDPSITAMALDMIISECFMEAKMAELNLGITDEEMAELETIWNEQVVAVAAQMLQYGMAETEEAAMTAAKEYAAEQGYTMDYLKKIKESEKVIVELTKEVTVSDEEIQAQYDSKVAEDTQIFGGDAGLTNYAMMEMYHNYGYLASFDPYYIPEGIRVINHILLETDEELVNQYNDLLARLEESQDEADKAAEGETAETAETAEASETAEEAVEPVTLADKEALEAQIIASKQEVITQIMTKLDNGVAFFDLVKEYGTDPGASAEGYQVHKDSNFVDAFRIGAFEKLQKVGDVSEPVVSEYGVHILYYQDDVAAGPVPLDDARKAVITSELKQTKESTLLNEKLEAWKASVTIETYEGYTLQ